MNSEQIEKLINDWQLWPAICSERPSTDDFTPLVNGLTNSNILLTTQDSQSTKQYVFRFNAPNAQSLGLNRHAEWHIHQSIAQYNICTPFVYRDPKDIYWVRPYLKNTILHEQLLHSDEDQVNTLLRQTAKKLKLVHSITASSAWPKINFKNRTDHYWKQIFNRIDASNLALKDTLTHLKEHSDAQLKSSGHTMRLCHMDPNPNNWIIDSDEIYLIDWEYSAIGDPSWDLAVFCDTCNLTLEQQTLFLKYYGSARIKYKQLYFAQLQMRYLSALWYCVQNVISPNNLVDAIIELEL